METASKQSDSTSMGRVLHCNAKLNLSQIARNSDSNTSSQVVKIYANTKYYASQMVPEQHANSRLSTQDGAIRV